MIVPKSIVWKDYAQMFVIIYFLEFWINQNLINKLENVQLDAAKIVTRGTKLTGLNRLYEETKWEKLSDRRQNHKLIWFFQD
jgi:hypothetical protein